ncbi:hypothetical protein [Azospirillum sp. TSO35-2]|uniref:hypothetical protein n=1 Tax=Azospirillum sp. TSO35-2 TaxID=716796 RepID=UPI000D6065B9|nr:hypothetical protein [Azospirillum sp. TSO35-2]PWC32330.1 hypothetical protein TSO352_16615 [Azospirillum sp. TSO35-2]
MAADDRNTPKDRGPSDSGGIDERPIPLDIRETRDHPDIDEQVEGFQRVIGPGAGTATDRQGREEDFGIPGSEEASGLGTGPLPPRQPDHPQRPAGGRDDGSPGDRPDDRIVSDRNVAVDGARDRR